MMKSIAVLTMISEGVGAGMSLQMEVLNMLDLALQRICQKSVLDMLKLQKLSCSMTGTIMAINLGQ